MTKLVNPMVIFKEGLYWMRLAYCSVCNYKKIVPIQESGHRCIYCKRILNYKWKELGDKLDYDEYFSPRTNKKMKRGKDFTY